MREVTVVSGTKLEQLLKFAGAVGTGGEAKYMIQQGHVRVNGKIETRRGYKVKEGDVIEFEDEKIRISFQL